MALNMLRNLALASVLIAGNSLAYAETIGRFHVKQGVATDSATGLMWLRCPLGMKWGDDTCSGKPTLYKWDGALQTPNRFSSAGYKDWRVPTIDELKTLIDKEVGNSNNGIPYINSLVFPRTLYSDENGNKGGWMLTAMSMRGSWTSTMVTTTTTVRTATTRSGWCARDSDFWFLVGKLAAHFV